MTHCHTDVIGLVIGNNKNAIDMQQFDKVGFYGVTMMTCDDREITPFQGVKSSDAYLCMPMDRYKNRVNVLSSLFSLKIFKSILIRLTEGEMTIYSENAKERTVSGTSLLFLAKNQTVIIALKADEKKPLYDILELDTETIKNAYRYFF